MRLTEERMRELVQPENMQSFEESMRRLTPEQAVQLCRRITLWLGVWKKYPYAEHSPLREQAGLPNVGSQPLQLMRQKLSEIMESNHGIFYKLGMDGKSYFFDRRTARPIVVFPPELVQEKM